MSSPVLPPIGSLATLPDAERATALDLLFEPSPTLHATALDVTAHSHEYQSYSDLIDAIHGKLTRLMNSRSELDRSHLDAILNSHPRLGAPKVDSAQSRAEQAKLNEGAGAQAQQLAKQLASLNREYEQKFESLRYVVFVNGRGRDVIMQDMRRRIDRGDVDEERKEAVQAMCDIAKDRARKLQTSEGAGKQM